MALAEKAGLPDLVTEHVSVPGSAGANADLKIGSLVAGMITVAHGIEEMDVVRHCGMDRVFAERKRPDRWAPTCAPTPSATSASWTPARLILVNVAGIVPGLWSVPSQSATWTSTTRSAPPTGTPSRAPGTATPASRASTSRSRPCPPRPQHRCSGPEGCARATPPPTTRTRLIMPTHRHRPPGRGDRHPDRARGLAVLQLRRIGRPRRPGRLPPPPYPDEVWDGSCSWPEPVGLHETTRRRERPRQHLPPPPFPLPPAVFTDSPLSMLAVQQATRPQSSPT